MQDILCVHDHNHYHHHYFYHKLISLFLAFLLYFKFISQIKFLGFLEKAKMKAVRSYSKNINTSAAKHETKDLDNKKTNMNIKKDGDDSETKQPNTFFNVIESAHGAAVEKANIWTS